MNYYVQIYKLRTGQDAPPEEIEQQSQFLDRIEPGGLLNLEDSERRKLEDLKREKGLESKEQPAEELQRQLEFKTKREQLDQIVLDNKLKINPVLIEGTTNEQYLKIIEEALAEKNEQEAEAEKIRVEQEKIEQKAIRTRRELEALEQSRASEEAIEEKKNEVMAQSLLNPIGVTKIMNDILTMTKASITKESIATKNKYLNDVKAFSINKGKASINPLYLEAIAKDSGAKQLYASTYAKVFALERYLGLNYLTEREQQTIRDTIANFRILQSDAIRGLRFKLNKILNSSYGTGKLDERIEKANSFNQERLKLNIANPDFV